MQKSATGAFDEGADGYFGGVTVVGRGIPVTSSQREGEGAGEKVLKRRTRGRRKEEEEGGEKKRGRSGRRRKKRK